MGLKTKGVLTFLLISFGLAWGAILVAHFVLDMSLVNPLVQIPVAFSPAIAAVIVRKWVIGEGFRDAGLRPRVRTARFYYLLAALCAWILLTGQLRSSSDAGARKPTVEKFRETHAA
jgi:hypothetical protein